MGRMRYGLGGWRGVVGLAAILALAASGCVAKRSGDPAGGEAAAATHGAMEPEGADAPAALAVEPSEKPKPRNIGEALGNLFRGKERPPRAVEPTLLGEIKHVNAENRFVLLDAGISSAASAGDDLLSLSGTTQTGTLRMTSLRSASFFIADIVSGSPSAGDRVYRK